MAGTTAGRSTDPRIPALRTAVVAHCAADDRELRSCEELLHVLETLPAPFDEVADPTHVTGAAIVSDGLGRVVLHRHKRLGIWLQPGGHVDAGEDPAGAALRETWEETGLQGWHPDGRPHLLHVDAHPGPRGHRHLDIRYLVLSEPSATLAPAHGESPDVAWFSLEDAFGVADASLAAAITALQRV